MNIEVIKDIIESGEFCEIEIKDSKGNILFSMDPDGYWEKKKFDSKGNRIYFEDSHGWWSKKEFDSKGNVLYAEYSDGTIL